LDCGNSCKKKTPTKQGNKDGVEKGGSVKSIAKTKTRTVLIKAGKLAF